MGLEMYVEAEVYAGGWNHSNAEDKSLYNEITNMVGLNKLASSDSPFCTVCVNVAYWRKANSIHAWMVQNLADGKDECQRIYLDHDHINKLINKCKAALSLYRSGEIEGAGRMMPPQGGFFFGNTDVKDCWAKDMEDTIKQLAPLLDPELSKKYSFYYRASW